MGLQSVWKAFFIQLQKMGKSLMLPVSVLPIAGILLGIGSAKFGILPESLSHIMAESGGAIFGILPLLCAVGVALGLTENDGVAALATLVGYVVLLATMGVMAGLLGHDAKPILGINSIETGVFGGILMGIIASYLFKKYYRIQLPSYLGFFAGKRFVPIITAFAAITTGIVLSFIWPPIGNGINTFSHWAAAGDPKMAFTLYGLVERALIPFGLHHIWNAPFFFQAGTYTDPATGKVFVGEIARYVAGDPTAGNMAGGYLFKMWGLPAAAIAIWHSAKPENRVKVGGIMVSAALTSFLTGITEPIEFSFLFLAPVLYGIHAVLAGIAYYTCIALGIKHGFTFSHGLIDYIVLFPKSTNGLWLLVVGPIWAAVYYFVFRYAIRLFDIKTPGREDEELVSALAPPVGTGSSLSKELILAFGGRANIVSLDACVTRLRVEVKQVSKASEDKLRALGATGVLKVANGVQAIFGTRSENLKTDMEDYLKTHSMEEDEAVSAPASSASATAATAQKPAVGKPSAVRADALLAALGGVQNIKEAVQPCAETRLRLVLKNDASVDPVALNSAGANGMMKFSGGILHVLVGLGAESCAAEINAQLQRAGVSIPKAATPVLNA